MALWSVAACVSRGVGTEVYTKNLSRNTYLEGQILAMFPMEDSKDKSFQQQSTFTLPPPLAPPYSLKNLHHISDMQSCPLTTPLPSEQRHGETDREKTPYTQ